MNDTIPEEELRTPKSDYENVSLKMGIVSILMIPLSMYFFYDEVVLFGMAFLIGSPILAIFGLVFLNNYKKDFVFFNDKQLNKFKLSKIICIVSICIGLLTILLGTLLYIAVSATH